MTKWKKIILATVCLVLNLGYCFLGWYIFIFYMITSPNNEKFNINPYFRNIILPLLLLCHLIGEVIFLKICYKKLFHNKKLTLIFFVIINILIYVFPLWIGIIEYLIS
jgi:hypothetical protein